MKAIDWLMDEMGFTFRQVADVLGVTHTLVHSVQFGRRRLPKIAEELLENPLLHPPEGAVENFTPVWSDGDDKNRVIDWTFRKGLAQKRKEKLEETLRKLETRNQQLQRILSHTKDLVVGDKSDPKKYLVELWWDIQKEKAGLKLAKFTRYRYEKIQFQLVLAEKEIEMTDLFLKEPG